MLKLETTCKKQKTKIETLEQQLSGLQDLLDNQKQALTKYKVHSSKTIANAIQNIQERKNRNRGFNGYMN